MFPGINQVPQMNFPLVEHDRKCHCMLVFQVQPQKCFLEYNFYENILLLSEICFCALLNVDSLFVGGVLMFTCFLYSLKFLLDVRILNFNLNCQNHMSQ